MNAAATAERLAYYGQPLQRPAQPRHFGVAPSLVDEVRPLRRWALAALEAASLPGDRLCRRCRTIHTPERIPAGPWPRCVVCGGLTATARQP